MLFDKRPLKFILAGVTLKSIINEKTSDSLIIPPFQKIGPSMFILHDLSGKIDSLPANGLILKNFFT